jgi:uncharacterized protein (DUF302 family)
MKLIRNLLALIGLAVVVGAGYAYYKARPIIERLEPDVLAMYRNVASKEFDPDAIAVYWHVASRIAETGSGAEAAVWKVPVEEGLSPEDVEQTMKFVANEHNFSNVGELPLSQDVEAKSAQPWRFAKVYLFCNSLIAKKMMDYHDAFSAYLPCRVTLVQDAQGKLWLYTLNMDIMIHGGTPLPAELKAQALEVKEIILDIMNRGAKGEF